ncbi:MAG: glycosyltransferase family 87 protein, partial [Isosphaeraceae bacterium]
MIAASLQKRQEAVAYLGPATSPIAHSSLEAGDCFFFIGGDFGIYRSIAKATLAVGARAMYDLDLVAPFARELMSYYGPDPHGLNLGPGPYPAVYILPFMALTFCPPPLGYAIWTCLGLAIGCAVARGEAGPSPRPWSVVLSGVVYFPVVSALIYGQLTMLFVYGFYRAYHDLTNGRDLRAGLWCETLYLKPQYVAFPLLVFLLKKRWRAAGGLLLAGLVVLLGSLAIVGPEGMIAQYRTLQDMSGFRDVNWIVGPRLMINWRGVLANVLPGDISDRTGQLLTLGFSVATLGVLPLVWRGRWNPNGDRFPVAMLATVIVMMMASYHNHIHSAALLMVPGMEVAAQPGGSRVLKALL